jgi:hypothetical protein
VLSDLLAPILCVLGKSNSRDVRNLALLVNYSHCTIIHMILSLMIYDTRDVDVCVRDLLA